MVDAREYHERTHHTPEGVRSDTFRLDFANQPRPYKVYEDRPQVTPTSPPDPPETPALEAIATSSARPDGAMDPPVDAQDLLLLCQYATGITKERAVDGQTMRYRAAACTGKLYHIDLYPVVGDIEGLAPGVYHFDPAEGALDVLREGDYRGVLERASGGHSAVADAPVTFVATSEWWRNAWKYRARTYRHAFWDSGTVLANLLAVAHGGGHRASVVTAFAEAPVTRLLGVDPESEAPLELIPVGQGDPVPAPSELDTIHPTESPVSADVVEYPLVPDAWRQSTLTDGEAAVAWRDQLHGASHLGTTAPGDGATVALDPVDAETASSRPIGRTIERRGSLREYSHAPISARLFATVIDRALRGIPHDGPRARLVDFYCLVHAVEGIDSGAYQYHPGAGTLERLGETNRRSAGHLALDQPVVGDAAVNLYVMADIDTIVETAGNRGYRLAQLVGGISLGRLYLATYAHRRIGGRGFTFYDTQVTDQFAPRATDQTPMTLFAFGRPPD